MNGKGVDAERPLRIFIWNINALTPTVRNIVLKYERFGGFIAHYNADIVCFQETKIFSTEKLTKELACVDGYESFWAISRSKKGYSGVVTYVRELYSPVAARVDCIGGGDSDLDQEGRVVETDHGSFVLLNVYVPNAGGAREGRPRADFKLRFLQALSARCSELLATGRQRDVHPKFSWADMYGPEEKAEIAALLAALPDVWRQRHPDVCNAFTVWDEKTSARIVNEGVRIDYALVSPGLTVASCEIVDTHPKWSDHAALLLELRGVAPPPPHAPCAGSSARDRRFRDPSQPSVAALFGGRRPSNTKPAPGPSPADRPDGAAGPAAAALAGGGERTGSGAEQRTGAAAAAPAGAEAAPRDGAAAGGSAAGRSEALGERDGAAEAAANGPAAAAAGGPPASGRLGGGSGPGAERPLGDDPGGVGSTPGPEAGYPPCAGPLAQAAAAHSSGCAPAGQSLNHRQGDPGAGPSTGAGPAAAGALSAAAEAQAAGRAADGCADAPPGMPGDPAAGASGGGGVAAHEAVVRGARDRAGGAAGRAAGRGGKRPLAEPASGAAARGSKRAGSGGQPGGGGQRSIRSFFGAAPGRGAGGS